MAGGVIKSWDGASLTCHLLPCPVFSWMGHKPPCPELHGVKGPPSTPVPGLWARKRGYCPPRCGWHRG